MEFHYGKHHKGYVDTLNELIPRTEFEELRLEDIIRRAPPGKVFNNAAQVWNHTFFWNCMKPGGSKPSGRLAEAIAAEWGSHDAFTEAFTESAVDNFGSGWTWLVRRRDGSLDIVNTSNAANPLTTSDVALLTIDVWEHAYYIDYRNRRVEFVKAVMGHLINWDFAARNMA